MQKISPVSFSDNNDLPLASHLATRAAAEGHCAAQTEHHPHSGPWLAAIHAIKRQKSSPHGKQIVNFLSFVLLSKKEQGGWYECISNMYSGDRGMHAAWLR